MLAIAPDATASFSTVVSPPRYELRAQPGTVVRESMEIAIDGAGVGDNAIYTADWELAADGSPTYREGDLAPGSCRPWVRLESREVRVLARQRRKFRFEIHVPPDAPTGECRFAIMVEGKDPTFAGSGTIRVPLHGRIAVIVYLAIGGAKPSLEVKSVQTSIVNGRPLPTITLENTGTAHGRPEGAIEGRDATGRLLEFSVATSPVLPGSTRVIPLWPNEERGGKSPAIEYPLRLKGTVEWAGGRYELDTVLRP